MVLVGGHWQGWFQPTGSPWKPPCCASYLHGVPTNLSWHQFPSSSILAMSLTWVSLWPTTKTYIFWPVRGWGHFLWQWGSNVIVIFFFILQLMVLYAVPDLDLISHLPEFLDGLFNIFKDRNSEIRKMLVHSDIWQIPLDFQCCITPFIGDLTKAVAYM